MAIPNPNSLWAEVSGGAWVDQLGSSTFTDTGTPTYGGLGDDEYAEYDGITETTLMNTPGSLPWNPGSDWTLGFRGSMAATPSGDEAFMGTGHPSSGSDRLHFHVDSGSRFEMKYDTGGTGSTLSAGSLNPDDGTAFNGIARYDSVANMLYLYHKGSQVASLDTTGYETPDWSGLNIGSARWNGGATEHGAVRMQWVVGWDYDIGATAIGEIANLARPFGAVAVPSAAYRGQAQRNRRLVGWR